MLIEKEIKLSILHKTPLNFIKNHPACDAKILIDGELIDAEFVIDTGADITVLPLSYVYELDIDSRTVAKDYDCGGIGNGKLIGRIITADSLIVANYSVRTPYIFIPDDENWSIPILGFDMLRGVYPFIDTKDGCVWFTRIKDAGVTKIPSIGLELRCDVLLKEL